MNKLISLRKKITTELKGGLYEDFTNDITVNNCNCRLDYLYKKRDDVSNRFSLCYDGKNYEDKHRKLQEQYDHICDVIDVLLEFRRNNPGCLLKGDEGYSLN